VGSCAAGTTLLLCRVCDILRLLQTFFPHYKHLWPERRFRIIQAVFRFVFAGEKRLILPMFCAKSGYNSSEENRFKKGEFNICSWSYLPAPAPFPSRGG
jgi:hypothetical protein